MHLISVSIFSLEEHPRRWFSGTCERWSNDANSLRASTRMWLRSNSARK
jgi:hypothetical protein